MFHKTICFEKKSHLFYMNIGLKKGLSHCLIFLMYKKAPFPQSAQFLATAIALIKPKDQSTA